MEDISLDQLSLRNVELVRNLLIRHFNDMQIINAGKTMTYGIVTMGDRLKVFFLDSKGGSISEAISIFCESVELEDLKKDRPLEVDFNDSYSIDGATLPSNLSLWIDGAEKESKPAGLES